jgi:hypothetical protein
MDERQRIRIFERDNGVEQPGGVMQQQQGRITEWLLGFNPDALTADGFEDAFLGICEQFGRPPVAAYDYDACIKLLVERDGASQEEAVEFFDFNVIGAWVGGSTPVFVTLWEDE